MLTVMNEHEKLSVLWTSPRKKKTCMIFIFVIESIDTFYFAMLTLGLSVKSGLLMTYCSTLEFSRKGVSYLQVMFW